LLNFSILAQDLNVGFGLQASLYKKYDLIKSEGITDIVLYPPEIHFSFEYLPLEILGIEFRIGLVIEPLETGISGIEYSALVKYYIEPSFYAIGIYINHFRMPGFGFGFIPKEHICLELTYLDPKDVIIKEEYSFFEQRPYKQIQLNWLIRMNIEFYFSL
jgi:hypothetical protein